MFALALNFQQLDFLSWCESWGWCTVDDIQKGIQNGKTSQLDTIHAHSSCVMTTISPRI